MYSHSMVGYELELMFQEDSDIFRLSRINVCVVNPQLSLEMMMGSTVNY